jgi:hypothetical protein
MAGPEVAGQCIGFLLALAGVISWFTALVRIGDPDYFFYDQGQPCVVTRVLPSGTAIASSSNVSVPCYIAPPDYARWVLGNRTRCKPKNKVPGACWNGYELQYERDTTVGLLCFGCVMMAFLLGIPLGLVLCTFHAKRASRRGARARGTSRGAAVPNPTADQIHTEHTGTETELTQTIVL